MASAKATSGIRVAAGDVTGDGLADIIVGTVEDGTTHVTAFDGTSLTTLQIGDGLGKAKKAKRIVFDGDDVYTL